MKSIKPVIGIILVFTLGAGSGSVATYLFTRTHFEKNHGAPHSKEEMLFRRLTARLDLDSQQQQRVRAVIHETHEKIHQVRQRMHPEIEALVTEGQQRIRTFLRPEQQRIFEEIIAERKAHNHHDRR